MEMTTLLRRAIVPAYLFACLLLGGASAAGFIANFALQLAALPIIGWAMYAMARTRNFAGARSLLILTGLLVLTFVAQLIPLPPALWTILPGREAVARGYAMLGIPLPWLPLSLSPEATLASLLWLLPAFAVLLAMTILGAFRAAWVAVAVIAVTALGVLVGALQIVGGPDSPWYFYAITNWGQAVGFFANSNHAATLLVVSIPFLAALQASELSRARTASRASGLMVITSAAFLVVAVGLVINFSIAGLGLAVPVTVASFLLLGANEGRRIRLGAALSGLLVVVVVVLIFVGPFANTLSEKLAHADTNRIEQLTRQTSISQTLAAARDYLPFGSGVGTFQNIYRTTEDPAATITVFMNHAHSDLAEIILETGVVGIALVVLLLLWWGRRAVALWRAPQPDFFARAATIAAGAMMAHSLVDYPLRTAALSALFAACLALMAEARPFSTARRSRTAARHLSV